MDIGREALFARSHDRRKACQHLVIQDGGTCEPCQQLEYIKKLQDAFTITLKPTEEVISAAYNHPVLSPTQQLGRLKSYRDIASRAKLEVLTLQRRCHKLERAIDDYKRILLLLSQGRIPHARQAIALCIRRGRSSSATFAILRQCLDGVYKPRGHFTIDEIHAAVLVLRLGGPKLCHILHKIEGLPSESYLRNHCLLKTFTPV